MEQRMNKVVIAARYQLRVEDFENHHLLLVTCDHCGHVGQVPAVSLRQLCRPHERILTITSRLKCGRCKKRGMAFWETAERLQGD